MYTLGLLAHRPGPEGFVGSSTAFAGGRPGRGIRPVGTGEQFPLGENIRPGLGPQLEVLRSLSDQGLIRVETMADTAAWFRGTYALTPPMTFTASRDWDESRKLSAQWYAGPRYRVGFLAEGGHLRIRDLFLYRQDYPSRYYDRALTGSKSVFDALPVLFPQAWGEPRAFLRLRTPSGGEPTGAVRYRALDRLTARAELWSGEDRIVAFTMEPHAVGWEGTCSLCFDRLPVLVELRGREVVLEHEGFRYGFRVDRGRVRIKGPGLEIEPEDGQAAITFGPPVEGIFRPDPPAPPEPVRSPVRSAPPMAPEMEPGASVFAWGAPAQVRLRVRLRAREPGQIRYTLDGSAPGPASPVYREPLTLRDDTTVTARLFLPDGRTSEAVRASYRFGLEELELESPTVLDARPVFCGGGAADLLLPLRGSLDYLDGRWRGTPFGPSCRNPEGGLRFPGLLSHHRSGIVYPQWVELLHRPGPGPSAAAQPHHLALRPGGPGDC